MGTQETGRQPTDPEDGFEIDKLPDSVEKIIRLLASLFSNCFAFWWCPANFLCTRAKQTSKKNDITVVSLFLTLNAICLWAPQAVGYLFLTKAATMESDTIDAILEQSLAKTVFGPWV